MKTIAVCKYVAGGDMMLKELIRAISGNAVDKVADAYTEAKRLEHEKELEQQRLEEEKRKSRRPVMITLIAICVIAIAVIWIKPADILADKLFPSIILFPLLVFFIRML